jgi:diguanylate cyclase (GGDEF)-like protein
VAAAIQREKRTLYLFLGIGLALLYAVLFRIVARASRRLRHLALHDALTGLPNRTLFHERVERAIKGSRSDRTVAVLLVDLDRFKEVNDTLGHDHGDELLKVVAERLGGALRQGDTLARLGGDEFAVVLTDLPHRGAAAETASRLHDALRRPFGLRGIAVELDASVGVALCPEHGRDVTTLIQRADVAMYDAKNSEARVATYSIERDPYSPARLSLLGELRRAIEGDELVLHYQPKVSLDADRVRLSLDDFGTGQASLAYLKQLPLDEVKIDRAFVTTMADDDGDAVIVRSTIDLARNLGLEVVAEGVESESVLEALVDLRCNSAQGYFLSRPLPSGELGAWLTKRSTTSRTSGKVPA